MLQAGRSRGADQFTPNRVKLAVIFATGSWGVEAVLIGEGMPATVRKTRPAFHRKLGKTGISLRSPAPKFQG